VTLDMYHSIMYSDLIYTTQLGTVHVSSQSVDSKLAYGLT